MANAASPMDAGQPSFGALLQQYRLASGLTQEGLAERAGLSVRGLSDLERGVNAAPRRDTLAMLLDALDLAPAARSNLMRAAQTPRRSPARPAPSHTTGALPTQGDALIGRDTDLGRVMALLHDPSVRLITITGPGGTGKTRLAIALGHRLAATGRLVVWAPLASVRSAGPALVSVAAALGVEDRGSMPLADLLARSLADRPHVLILDNLEQIPDLAPDLDRLLAAVPTLVILATSRAPLRLRGERRYPLQPLSLSVDHELHENASAFSSPAAELFVRRAEEIDANFALTAQSAEAVQAICTRLDGLPLAIELAAARSALLPPAALLARLERALPLLTTGPLNAPDRQRTLRDAIAWSYDLLPAETQRVFRRVAVCLHGFTLETADRLLPGITTDDVLDHLSVLLEQSLLRTMPGASPPRYVMLETVREFALEQLYGTGKESDAYLLHARWFAEHVAALNAMLSGPEVLAGLRVLDAELPNIRQAMSTLLAEPAMVDEACDLATNLGFYSYLRGLHSESLRWFTQILERRDQLPDLQVSHLLLVASAALNVRGDPDGETLARESRDLMTTLAADPAFDDGNLGEACLYLADCIEDPLQRRQILEEGLDYTRRSSRRADEAFLLAMHGLTCAELGDFAAALASGEHALAIQYETGGLIGIGHAAGQLGHSLRMQGHFLAAEKHLLTAFRCFWATGALGWTAGAVEGLADCAAQTSQPERAAWLYGAASQLRMRSGWTTDLILFGRSPETLQTLHDALGDRAFAEVQAAGAAASWQELHDVVLDESASQPR